MLRGYREEFAELVKRIDLAEAPTIRAIDFASNGFPELARKPAAARAIETSRSDRSPLEPEDRMATHRMIRETPPRASAGRLLRDRRPQDSPARQSR